MIGVFDVGYDGDRAAVGCLTICNFDDVVPQDEWVVDAGLAGPYVPGQFWRRELTPLLRGIGSAPDLVVCVIDAYVDLGEERKPGLGRLLFEAIGIPVIGVAKSRYPGTPQGFDLLRRSSRRPLYVSSAGMDQRQAKGCIESMAGDGRVPALIRRADVLSKSLAPPQ